MTLKKLIAGLGVVLVTLLGGVALSHSATHAVPPAASAPASVEPGTGGEGDNGIWP